MNEETKIQAFNYDVENEIAKRDNADMLASLIDEHSISLSSRPVISINSNDVQFIRKTADDIERVFGISEYQITRSQATSPNPERFKDPKPTNVLTYRRSSDVLKLLEIALPFMKNSRTIERAKRAIQICKEIQRPRSFFHGPTMIKRIYFSGKSSKSDGTRSL